MNLQKQINQDFISAMKNKETQKVSVLRMLKSALKNKEIELKKSLTDQEAGEIVVKEVKQRKDSIEEFTRGDRPELAQKEKSEITVLEKYMPKQLSEAEIGKIVDEAISKISACTPSDMGKVMAVIMPKLKEKVDGSLVSKMVKEKLIK